MWSRNLRWSPTLSYPVDGEAGLLAQDQVVFRSAQHKTTSHFSLDLTLSICHSPLFALVYCK